MIEDLLEAEAVAWRPLERLKPSAFAERFRFLKDGTTARPGRFSHEDFEFLIPIEDAALESVESGRKLVFMKPAQIGGSEAMLNVLAWVATYMPGPTLYMTSTEDVAKEFSKDRLAHICDTCEPISKKFLARTVTGIRDEIHWKRFTDGKIAIVGGKTINNFQSQPYRNVFVDEADSLQDQLAGQGDPIKLAELRTQAYALFGSTFMTAFAHPSTKEHGVGKIYYEDSDQRRGFVRCPHCPNGEFWLQWEHVKALPRDGQAPAVAERDPSCYVYVAPCCGSPLSDAERIGAARKSVQKSILPPEVARTKPWIGVHTSHLYTKTIDELARAWIEGIDSPAVRRVVVNKIFGDVFEEAENEVSIDAWVGLAVADKTPDFYRRGRVPEGVQFLTAGQDSRLMELHWAVWGWGHVMSDAEVPVLCGWLVDYGVEPGPASSDKSRRTLDASDLHVFDQVLYDRYWPGAKDESKQFHVEIGLHDSGWQPIAAYTYALSRRGRAFPSKGLATDDRSRAPAFTWAGSVKWRVGEQEVSDPALRRFDINTFILKMDFTSFPEKKFKTKDGVPKPRLYLPEDVTSEFLEHLASERLIAERGKRTWRRRGPNHWFDCSIQAYAAALNLAPLSPAASKTPPAPTSSPASPWWNGSRGGKSWWE